jgi:molecular chaperone GrpE
VGFAIAPAVDSTTLERLDFVPLDGGRVLVIVVGTGGHISHKVIEPSDDYDRTELQQAANYLNSEFKGRSLLEVRQAVLERAARGAHAYDVLLAALSPGELDFADLDSAPTLFVQGMSLLFDDVNGDDPEVTIERLRTLLRMIEEKTRLLQLLDDYIGGRPDDCHRIGAQCAGSQRFSLVVSSYLDGRGARGRRNRPAADALLEGDQRRRLVVQGHQPDGRVQALILARTGRDRPFFHKTYGRATTRTRLPNPRLRSAGPAPSADTETIQAQRDGYYYDLLLRKTAEFDNYRKRTERDRQSLNEAAAASMIEELLPLVDDLERALKAEPGAEGAETYRRGVELIHKRLEDILRRRGVRPIEALGADFDPNFHEAVAHEPAEGRRDGEVIEEFRRGYMLGDRLLRPSMVKVAKGAQ